MQPDDSYFIVSLLPDEITQRINEARDQILYNPHSIEPARFVLLDIPHMTIKSSFFLKDVSETVFVNLLREIGFSRFILSFRITELIKTKRYGNVVIVKPDTNPGMISLHQQIIGKINPHIQNKHLNIYEGIGYTPHVSMFYNLPDEDIQLGDVYVKDHMVPFNLDLTTFQLMKSIRGLKPERKIVAEFKANL